MNSLIIFLSVVSQSCSGGSCSVASGGYQPQAVYQPSYRLYQPLQPTIRYSYQPQITTYSVPAIQERIPTSTVVFDSDVPERRIMATPQFYTNDYYETEFLSKPFLGATQIQIEQLGLTNNARFTLFDKSPNLRWTTNNQVCILRKLPNSDNHVSVYNVNLLDSSFLNKGESLKLITYAKAQAPAMLTLFDYRGRIVRHEDLRPVILSD
jgi:hypothetical protein